MNISEEVQLFRKKMQPELYGFVAYLAEKKATGLVDIYTYVSGTEAFLVLWCAPGLIQRNLLLPELYRSCPNLTADPSRLCVEYSWEEGGLPIQFKYSPARAASWKAGRTYTMRLTVNVLPGIW